MFVTGPAVAGATLGLLVCYDTCINYNTRWGVLC